VTDIREAVLGAETVKEAVFLALGAASVCWERIDQAGVFNSDRAALIGDALMERLDEEKS
jgi:hypothetical protein